jgi:putative endonuclease
MSRLSESNQRKLGQAGEKIARTWLETRGYDYVAANVYTRQGELDLIMQKENTLVFVEVKLRRSVKQGHPLEALTPRKKQHLLQAAHYYLLKHPHAGPIRFDAVGLEQIGNANLRVTHIENAIQCD